MISVIITAYKEENTIGKAIEAFLRSKFPDKYEILVLAPDTETLEAARKFTKKSRNLKVIQDPGKGKPTALNLAFKKAKGKILIFTDGDVHVDKTAIPNLLSPFSDQKIGAVAGHPVSINNRKTMLGFWSHLLTDIADIRRRKAIKIRKRFYCSGYLYAMRAGIVNEIPENVLVDDGYISHLVWEAGYKIAYSPESKVCVKYPTNVKDWLKQKLRSAGGYIQLKDMQNVEIRSLKKESSGFLDFFRYVKSFKEFIWLGSLFLTRLYLWFLIIYNFKIKRELEKEGHLKKIWKRVDSTK